MESVDVDDTPSLYFTPSSPSVFASHPPPSLNALYLCPLFPPLLLPSLLVFSPCHLSLHPLPPLHHSPSHLQSSSIPLFLAPPSTCSHFSSHSILLAIFNSFVSLPPLSSIILSAGGLLSERYLGKAEPSSRAEINTASLSKYKNVIDTWGGWSLFQDLLVALETTAKKHDCSVASVATRYVLDRPAVGGVIVGCRLGVAGAGQHISDSLRSCSPDLKLQQEDLAAIEAVTRRSRDLMALIGDCGDEYRSQRGRARLGGLTDWM